MGINEMDQDQGLAFHLAQFQARGYHHTQSLDGELLLGVSPNEQEQEQQQNYKLKTNLEVEWEQQKQDQSLNKVVDADIGKRLNQPNPSSRFTTQMTLSFR